MALPMPGEQRHLAHTYKLQTNRLTKHHIIKMPLLGEWSDEVCELLHVFYAQEELREMEEGGWATSLEVRSQ